MGRMRWAEWFFEPLFSFAFPLPKIALIPLFVQWFGLFDLSKVMLIFTDCLFPLVHLQLSRRQGRQPDLPVVGAGARHRPLARMLWRVVLPLSLASIYDGVQVAVVVARAGRRRHRDGLGRQRPRLDDDPRLSLRRRAHRVRDAAHDLADRLRRSTTLAQWLRGRLLSWHTLET